MTDKETVMVYRSGSDVQCGPHLVAFKIVNEDEVKAALAAGWFKTPQDVAEAEEAARLKEQIATNDALLKKTDAGGKTPRQPRSPRKPATETGTTPVPEGENGADNTDAGGANVDNDEGND